MRSFILGGQRENEDHKTAIDELIGRSPVVLVVAWLGGQKVLLSSCRG